MTSRAICHLDATLDAKVSAAGAKKGWSSSSVIEAALKCSFSSAIEHERDGLLIKRLDDLNRPLARTERGNQARTELWDLGVHYQIMFGPRLDDRAMSGGHHAIPQRLRALPQATRTPPCARPQTPRRSARRCHLQ
jgi:hypothetical protein